MKKNKFKIALTIFSVLLTISVYAQGPPGGGQGGGRGEQGGQRGQQRGKPDATQIMSKLDLNNDKVIDKDEALKDERGKISEDFDLLDANGDEVIDLEELKDSLNNKRPRRITPEKLIKQIDDNGDGTLNELEVAAKGNQELSKNFSKIDTNGDGELTKEELEAYKGEDQKNERKKKRKLRD